MINPFAARLVQNDRYNPNSPCPKCGCHLVATNHVSFAYIGGGDALRRTCSRCGYSWDQRPKDAE